MCGTNRNRKTLVAKTIKMLDVPLAIVDATVLTESRLCWGRCREYFDTFASAADYDVAKPKAESFLLMK
jgi:ATP-dependent Clp protease ATP-binding subunit ClpX